MLAWDFFTVETVWLKRLYVLVFLSLATRRVEFVASTCCSSLELGSRRVHLAGCTTNPTGAG
jgi:hypothetical protein